MKKQSTTLFTKLSKETFNSLTREVKETLAPVFKTTPKKHLPLPIYGTSSGRERPWYSADLCFDPAPGQRTQKTLSETPRTSPAKTVSKPDTCCIDSEQ